MHELYRDLWDVHHRLIELHLSTHARMERMAEDRRQQEAEDREWNALSARTASINGSFHHEHRGKVYLIRYDSPADVEVEELRCDLGLALPGQAESVDVDELAWQQATRDHRNGTISVSPL